MRAQLLALSLVPALTLGLVACGGDEAEQPQAELARQAPPPPPGVEAIDDARLRAADTDAADWLTHGRTYAEQRYSPLDQIDASNVAQLGLAWSYDTDTTRGLEATPIVVDGVMYATGSWSVVYAVDARTGKQLWNYDPKVPREYGAQRLLRRRQPRRRRSARARSTSARSTAG